MPITRIAKIVIILFLLLSSWNFSFIKSKFFIYLGGGLNGGRVCFFASVIEHLRATNIGTIK